MSTAVELSSYRLGKIAEQAELDRIRQWVVDDRAAEVESQERALTELIRAVTGEPFAPSGFGGNTFGPGIGNQPPHDVLMRENMGAAARSTRAIKNRVATLKPVVKNHNTGELLPDNPLQALLDRPHPNLSRSQLYGLTTDWVITTGEAYWQKVRGTLLKNTTLQLQPIPPTQIEPIISGGVVGGYRAGNGVSTTRLFEADEIIRFYFPDPENIFGSEGYLGPAGITADSVKFAGQHLREHYRNDATPPTVLESSADSPPPPKPGSELANRLDATWIQKYHNIRGSSKGVPVQLPTGLKLVQMLMQSGADIVPLLQFWSEELMMDFGVPKSILGNITSGDRSSAEVNQYVFDRYAVSPIAVLLAEGMTLQLAGDFDPRLEVVFEDFVSADKEFLLKKRKQDLDTKQINIDQAREEDGKDPQPWGKDPVGTFAEVPYQGTPREDPRSGRSRRTIRVSALTDEELDAIHADEETELREPTPLMRSAHARISQADAAHRPPFTKELRKIFRKQLKDVLEKLKKFRSRIEAGDLFDPDEWFDEYKKTVEPIRGSAFVDVATDTLDELVPGSQYVHKESVVKALEREGAKMVQHIGETTKNNIARELAEASKAGEGTGPITKRIKAVFEDATDARARTIAQHEVGKASSQAQLEGFDQSGVVSQKQWNHSFIPEDARENHIAIDGQIRNTNEAFDLGGGVQAEAPRVGVGGGELEAAESIGCACFVTPVVEG